MLIIPWHFFCSLNLSWRVLRLHRLETMFGVISKYSLRDRDGKTSYATALEIQRDHTTGGAVATLLIFSLDGVGSVWRNNPSQRGNVATARSTEANRLRKIAGESEVSRSETFVFWVLKRCRYTNTPATIFFNIWIMMSCAKHLNKKSRWKQNIYKRRPRRRRSRER